MVLFSWSHQATGPIRLDTDLHLWFDQIIRRTQHEPHAMPVRAPYRHLQSGISNVFHIIRAPYRARVGPLRTRKEIDTTRICKNPERASYVAVRDPYGPLRYPHGLFMGCLRPLNPYGARKLIMHALKLYGTRTGRQNSYGAARVTYGPREWTYDFCFKKKHWTAIRGSWVWCDWGIRDRKQPVNSPCGDRKTRVPHGPHRIWKILKILVWGPRRPYKHRTGSLWSPTNYSIKP